MHTITLFSSESVLYSNKIFIQHYLSYKTFFFKIPSVNTVVDGHQTRRFLDPLNARPPIEINIRVKHNVTSNYKVFFL